MVVSVPQRGQGQPRRIGSFNCPTPILVQVTGPNTLFLGTNPDDLKQNPDGNQTVDGVQLTQPGTVTPFFCWWNGDLWAAGNVPMSFVLLVLGPSGPAQSPEVLQSDADPVEQAVTEYAQ